MAPLHELPRGALRLGDLRRLGGKPADRRRIEKDLRAGQCREARRLRKPLVPADQNAELADFGAEAQKSEIAGRKVKFLVKAGILGDMHLAVFADDRAVAAENDGGVVVNARRALLEQ